MGRTVAGAGLATAAVVCGGYSATEVFVPAQLRGISAGNAARGSRVEVDTDRSADTGASLLKPVAAVTGALALAAFRTARPTRVCRRASATAEPTIAADENNRESPPAPFNPADQFGVTQLGYFDPLGFCKVGDEKAFRQMRVAELKHGRVAMLASVGLLVQHYLQVPGLSTAPKGIGAVMNSPGGVLALLVFSGVIEAINWNLDWKEAPSNPVSKIGDYGNPWQVYPKNMDSMKNRELNNGRAAMVATLGILVAELATGKDGAQQLGWA